MTRREGAEARVPAAQDASLRLPYNYYNYLEFLAADSNAGYLPLRSYVGPFDPTHIPVDFLYQNAEEAVWSGRFVSFNDDVTIVRVGAPQFFLPAGEFFSAPVTYVLDEISDAYRYSTVSNVDYGHIRFSYDPYPRATFGTVGNDPEEGNDPPEPSPVEVAETWFAEIERYVAGTESGEFSSWYGEDG